MATNSSLKNQLQNNSTQAPGQAKQLGLKSLLNSPVVQEKFRDVLKEKSQGFTASVLSLVNNDSYLAQSEPMSIITCAMTAATLDLPLDKNLGYAYIVPFRDYKDGNKQKGQFILGYKGYIQLVQRSGQYEALNVIEVYEGELLSWNRLTEKFEFDPNGKLSDVVIGYVGYFKLLNGFEKTVYWTKQEVEAHRIRNNKTKNKTELSGVWKTDYDSMAKKTILRNILSKWGILSIEMQKAVTTDETVQTIDKETGDIRDITPDEDFDAMPDPEPNKLGTLVTEDGEIINLEDEAAQESLFEERTTKPKD